MSKLQDAHAAETLIDQTQINESEGKVWHRPAVTVWEIEEETLADGSGPELAK